MTSSGIALQTLIQQPSVTTTPSPTSYTADNSQVQSQPNAPRSSTATPITTPSAVQSNLASSTALPPQQVAGQDPNVAQTVIFAPSTHNGRLHRTSRSIFLYWLKPFTAFVVYIVTLGVASSASSRYTLLGLVNGTWGTWFLAILAKSGDLAFAFAVADVFDCLAWSKLRQRKIGSTSHNFDGTPLDWFLAMVSSTGISGLAMILRRSISNIRKGQNARSTPNKGVFKKIRERWKLWRTARWSLARVLCIVILIPGPGIIIMANIDQKEVFFSTDSMIVSAGLAIYEPDLATAFSSVVEPDISRLAQMMTRDPSITWPVKPVDPNCKASKTCKSQLIAGPYRTVQPWPFTVEDDNVDGFRLREAPFYQVDMWDVDREWELLSFNETKECNLYGGFQSKVEFSMIICLRQHAEDILVAGWKSCQSGYDNSTNQCLDPASAPSGKYGWATYLHFYRRKATVVFSRSLFTILSASDLSSPQSQAISAASLFQAINTMLYQPNRAPNDTQNDRKSQPYILTQVIGQDLWMSLNMRLSGLSIGKDWLRNLLILPVYLFQRTAIATAENVSPSGENGTAPLLGLQPENYVRGSHCIVHKRAVPGTETVIGYGCVAGLLLLFIVIMKWVAFKWLMTETSEFPLLDFDFLTVLVDKHMQEVSLRQRFRTIQGKYGNGVALEEMADVEIYLHNV